MAFRWHPCGRPFRSLLVLLMGLLLSPLERVNCFSSIVSSTQHFHVTSSPLRFAASFIYEEPSAIDEVPLLYIGEQAAQGLLIHWRGEGVEGYSRQFRQVEFSSALAAVYGIEDRYFEVGFVNALQYNGTELTNPLKVLGYNEAMQFLELPFNISISACIQAAQRCALIHAVYQIVAETIADESTAESYERLCQVAQQTNAFSDMHLEGRNAHQSWCVRVRHYGLKSANEADEEALSASKERRYGARARSLTLERRALQALAPVLRKLNGKVDLQHPDCKIYVFDGLLSSNQKVEGTSSLVLARRIATGARRQLTSIHPTSRMCVTNTPLCPIAAFVMANLARLHSYERGCAILDPFCGSGGILLAAALVLELVKSFPGCSQLVGIEISHDGIVNREDIRSDFKTRQLIEPVALLQGDSTDADVRSIARAAIGHRSFDAIITDPPYGIRESNKGGSTAASRPIDDLLQMIADDKAAGTPLLRIGGRLVVFLPHRVQEESMEEIFPTIEQLEAAGLTCEYTQEQPLNDALSRWLVSYVCVR